jgi:biotin transporter BioY
MSSIAAVPALPARRRVLADVIARPSSRARAFAVDAALVLAGAAVVALLAQVEIPLWPVPITGQTLGVIIVSWRRGDTLSRAGLRPAVLGIISGTFFAMSAIGYRGAIQALPEGGFLIRSSTILVLGLALQTAVLTLYMLVANRQALVLSLRNWRRSLSAGFLGAAASQFWFIGFSLTSAANVRTLALIEVPLELRPGRY